jgi:hypothetical protein
MAMATTDEAGRRLRALVADGFAWPEAPGIATDGDDYPRVAGQGAHLDSLMFTLHDARPAPDEEVATLVAHHRGLTADQARAALAYRAAYGPELDGRAWREWLDAGEFPPDRAAAEALLRDVGALLAALAAAESRAAATEAALEALVAALEVATRGWVLMPTFGDPHCRYCRATGVGVADYRHTDTCPVAVYEAALAARAAGRERRGDDGQPARDRGRAPDAGRAVGRPAARGLARGRAGLLARLAGAGALPEPDRGRHRRARRLADTRAGAARRGAGSAGGATVHRARAGATVPLTPARDPAGAARGRYAERTGPQGRGRVAMVSFDLAGVSTRPHAILRAMLTRVL